MTYPLSRYALDQHVDAGITNLSGTVDAIPHALAAIIWSLDRHAASWTIDLFTAAFSVDLVASNSPVTGMVTRASQQLYQHLSLPLMQTTLVAAGLWATWQLLVLRRYAQGAGRIGLCLVYCIGAIAIIQAPQQTVGAAAAASHDIATVALTSVMGSKDARDGLHESLVHEPWVLLNFGAATHCVNGDGDPVPPRGYSTDGEALAPRGGDCLDAHGLASDFLEHTPGSDDRNDAFNELNDGSDLDKQTVAIQTGAGGYDRVALAFGLAVAATGALLLIGGLALGMVASQLYALLLMACAPAALLAALIPGPGHHAFEVWVRQLAGAFFRGAVYCLYLTIAVALSLALQRSAPQIGGVGALTLQAILWWGLVIYGRQLSRRLGERAATTPVALAARGVAGRAIGAVPIMAALRSRPAQSEAPR